MKMPVISRSAQTQYYVYCSEAHNLEKQISIRDGRASDITLVAFKIETGR